jgi:type VI secretion system protein ImpG
MRADEDFLRYYFDELSYLRDAGRGFAREHDKVAKRLDMPHGETADPHVERLIESFAFLTARLQRQMKAEFPDITSALLGVLYPQLVQPLPPMAIACFDVGSTIKGLTDGFPIPRKTSLFAQDDSGLTCRFYTCYPATLWPVTVTEAVFEPADYHGIASGGAVLRIQLRASADLLRKPEFLASLRFFLDGPPELTGVLYDILFGTTTDVLLLDKSSPKPISLGVGALKSVGFGPEEEVLPYPANAQPGYRLLQEYFNFQEKFLFFDVEGLAKRPCTREAAADSDTLNLLFVLRDLPSPQPTIFANNFRLGCTPIINLFPKTSEPIRLDNLQLEYRLVADIRRETTTEIHSITSVTSSTNPAAPVQRYEPFYSFRHSASGTGSNAFWLARRTRSDRDDLRGTDMYLSFVDLAFNPAIPADRAVFAHTLCTNRWLASQLPDRAQLNIDDATPVLRIACVTKPTVPLYPPLGGPSLWRLVSSLSLNSASLTSDAHGLEALQEILRLYAFNERGFVQQQIGGICSMQTRKVLRRFGPDAWRGFRRGTEITFVFDVMRYKGSSPLLMASVLRHFLGLYASVNTFTEVVAKRSTIDGEWKRWAPLASTQEIL